jgi:hypothetical protein
MQLSGQFVRIRTVPHIPGNTAFKMGQFTSMIDLQILFTNTEQM